MMIIQTITYYTYLSRNFILTFDCEVKKMYHTCQIKLNDKLLSKIHEVLVMSRV